MFSLIGVDPTSAVNNDHSEPMFSPGEVYAYNHPTYGKIFVRYIKVDDANLAAGNVCQKSVTGYHYATNDISGGTHLANSVAGVALCAITDGNWGFIQVGGVGAVGIVTHNAGAAGDVLCAPGAADGRAAKFTTASNQTAAAQLMLLAGGRLGIVLAAGSSTTLAAGKYIIDRLLL